MPMEKILMEPRLLKKWAVTFALCMLTFAVFIAAYFFPYVFK